jgi:hypothetical protein
MNDRTKTPGTRWLGGAALAISLLAQAWPSLAQVPPQPQGQVPPAATALPRAPRPRVTLAPDQAAKVAAEQAEAAAKCWADLETLCPGIENRKDRIRCIRKHRENLPPSCRQAQQMRRAPPIRSVCMADGERLCKGMPRGRRRLKCLLEHRPEVSPECGQALDQRRGGPGPVRGPLAGDN